MGRSRVTDVRDTFIGGACAVAFCAVLALGQAAPAPTPAPSTTAASANAPSRPRLQAELLKTIDASTAKAGDEVTLKTMQPLEFDGAKYPAGAIVSGHVTQVDASHLAVIFDHIGVKKNSAVPLGLSLRAVMMPESPGRSTGDQISPRAAGAGNAGVDPAIQNPRGRGDMLRSPQAAVEDAAVSVFTVPPAAVKASNGGVIGLPGVQLTISPDPKAAATFQVDKDHTLKLDKGLQAIFVVSK